MKISQKLVSLRCRVLVKNKRLVVSWLLIEMHGLIAGWKQKEALLSSARQCPQTQQATRTLSFRVHRGPLRCS